MKAGWDDPLTARLYRNFENKHGRYRRANQALVRNAAPKPGLRVLDLAAGTGGTTAALLPSLGDAARVDCIEPAGAMADAGRERLGLDARVRWLRSLNDIEAGTWYDRIVCGAALWQWPDLRRLIKRLAQLLAPGGALVFDIPAAYLGQPDAPGGGSDPHLTALLAAAVHRHPSTTRAAPRATVQVQMQGAARTADDIQGWLQQAGLWPQAWQHCQRLTQAAWRDWLCIPVLTAQLWPGVSGEERARRINEAAQGLDRNSWRPERWLGWTAWKPCFDTAVLADAAPLLPEPQALSARASRDGALLLRALLPARGVGRLRGLVQRVARAEGLLDARGAWVGGAAVALHELAPWIALQQRLSLTTELHSLVNSPRLVRLLTQLSGQPMRPGLGSVCRIAPPDHLVPATPPHRDADYLPASEGVWSAWVPLLACSVPQGVPAVALGSHHKGGATRWAAADMAPGDVLLLRAQTLHRGCPNLRLRHPRLSIDIRFGPA